MELGALCCRDGLRELLFGGSRRSLATFVVVVIQAVVWEFVQARSGSLVCEVTSQGRIGSVGSWDSESIIATVTREVSPVSGALRTPRLAPPRGAWRGVDVISIPSIVPDAR